MCVLFILPIFCSLNSCAPNQLDGNEDGNTNFSVFVMYVCNSLNVKMKSRVKIVITVEFLVEFCIDWYHRSCYDDQYFSQNDDLNGFDELVIVVS